MCLPRRPTRSDDMGLIKRAGNLQKKAEKTYLDYDILLTEKDKELLKQIKKGRDRNALHIR